MHPNTITKKSSGLSADVPIISTLLCTAPPLNHIQKHLKALCTIREQEPTGPALIKCVDLNTQLNKNIIKKNYFPQINKSETNKNTGKSPPSSFCTDSTRRSCCSKCDIIYITLYNTGRLLLCPSFSNIVFVQVCCCKANFPAGAGRCTWISFLTAARTTNNLQLLPADTWLGSPADRLRSKTGGRGRWRARKRSIGGMRRRKWRDEEEAGDGGGEAGRKRGRRKRRNRKEE